MLPKMALILLICSCVLMELASGGRRHHRGRGKPIRRKLPPMPPCDEAEMSKWYSPPTEKPSTPTSVIDREGK